jgi:hypothetical protein
VVALVPPGAPGDPQVHLVWYFFFSKKAHLPGAAETQRPRPCPRPGCPWYSKDAPGVIEIHLRSTGAPLEWQVRPVSNTRMPEVHLAFQGRTWHLQVHLQFSRAHRALSRYTCSQQVRPGNGRCALFQISGCQVHLGIPRSRAARCTSGKSPGAPVASLASPGQVRLASPGAPDAYVIRQGAPEWQILNHW